MKKIIDTIWRFVLDWNRTEQNRTEQNRTEQNRTEQNRTEQNRTKVYYGRREGAI